jgi:hypothetical protein
VTRHRATRNPKAKTITSATWFQIPGGKNLGCPVEFELPGNKENLSQIKQKIINK